MKSPAESGWSARSTVGAMSNSDVVIVDAVRTPDRQAQRWPVHPAPRRAAGPCPDGRSSTAPVSSPTEVGQVVTGCVSQVGEQAFNIGRTAWLSAGLPMNVANTTVDTQCGSSQQATNLATSLVGSGVVDMALACGVEAMSRVPIGVAGNKALGLGIPIPKTYFEQYEMTSQFEGAERIADKWGITRADTDAFGFRRQQRRRAGVGRGSLLGPVHHRSRHPTSTRTAARPAPPTPSIRDEGLRETTLEKLASLKPVARENGVHTAGNSSQISRRCRSGAADDRGEGRGARPEGPGPRRRHLPRRHRPGAHAHRSDRRHPAPAWSAPACRSTTSTCSRSTRRSPRSCSPGPKEVGADLAKTNPNGGAIALGHPLGAHGERS